MTSTLSRVLIFGGSFNPPTLAHEAIMQACLALPQFDAVWVMPSGSRLDKKIPTNDEHRMNLLQAVRHGTFDDDPRLLVSNFELLLPRPSSQYQTMHELAKTYTKTEFWFALGGDSYRSRHQWVRAAEFLDDMHMVVFTDQAVAEANHEQLIHLHIPQTFEDVSSTAVRNAVRDGADCDAMVSLAVLGYIKQHGLYAPHPADAPL